MSAGAASLAAAAAGADPAAGRRRAVVDKNQIPDLSLRLFMPEILNRAKPDQALCLKTQPGCLSMKECPY